MKDLYEPATAAEIRTRIASLRPDSPRQWGTMDVAQMVAHCAVGMEMAVGDWRPKRLLIGRVLGGLVKERAVNGDEPMRRNSPTHPRMKLADQRQLDAERARLLALVERFVAGGPSACTDHPHTFFGPMTSTEWSRLMYKHLDHHLRQFGA